MSRADWNRRQMSNYLQLKNLCFQGCDLLCATQRRPSRNRANAGLRDAIPLGLKNRPLHQVGSPYIQYSTENSEEPHVAMEVVDSQNLGGDCTPSRSTTTHRQKVSILRTPAPVHSELPIHHSQFIEARRGKSATQNSSSPDRTKRTKLWVDPWCQWTQITASLLMASPQLGQNISSTAFVLFEESCIDSNTVG